MKTCNKVIIYHGTKFSTVLKKTFFAKTPICQNYIIKDDEPWKERLFPAVQSLDNFIKWINHNLVDIIQSKPQMNSDLFIA